MSILSHTLITLLGIHILGLHGWDLALAIGFGMLLDIDHLVKSPLYHKKRKEIGKDIRFYHWRTSLQEPVALLWIIPISIYLGTPVPVIFFLSHLILDYLVGFNKYPFYPFSTYTTKGLLYDMDARKKEVFMITALICLNLIAL